MLVRILAGLSLVAIAQFAQAATRVTSEDVVSRSNFAHLVLSMPFPTPSQTIRPETQWDITFDHESGDLIIHSWTIKDINGDVAFDLGPLTVDSLNLTGGTYEGDVPGGRINFWPKGTVPTSPQAYLLAYYPDPDPLIAASLWSVSPESQPWRLVSMSFQAPEPAGAGIMAVGLVSLAARRRSTTGR